MAYEALSLRVGAGAAGWVVGTYLSRRRRWMKQHYVSPAHPSPDERWGAGFRGAVGVAIVTRSGDSVFLWLSPSLFSLPRNPANMLNLRDPQESRPPAVKVNPFFLRH